MIVCKTAVACIRAAASRAGGPDIGRAAGIVSVVSVDVEVVLRDPFTLDAVLGRAHAVLSDLLDITTVPGLAVFAGRQYQQGRRTGAGLRLDASALAATVIGDPIVPGEAG